MHTQGSRATRKLRSCLVAVGGGRKQSAATLQLQALEQPHPHVMGWTWSSGRVIWPNGLSIKDLLYLLILLVTYMILGPLAPWGPGGRTCRPPPRAGPGDGALLPVRLREGDAAPRAAPACRRCRAR